MELSPNHEGYWFDFVSTHAILTPIIFDFWSVFILKPFPSVALCDDIGIKRCEIFGTSFGQYKKLVRKRLLTQTPTQKFKIGFWILNSKGISSILVSFGMIFGALQSLIFWFKFYSLSSKIPEFNLIILSHLNFLR